MKGFGRPTFSELRQLAGHRKVCITGGMTYFDVYKMVLTQCWPEASSDELMEVLMKRCLPESSLVGSACRDLEEVQDTMDESDKRVLQDRRKVEQSFDVGAEFQTSVFRFVRGNLAAETQKAQKVAAKAAAARTAAKRPGTERQFNPVAACISEEDAQQWMAPDFEVWKDPRENRWKARPNLMGTFSRSWMTHGEKASLGVVANWSWHQYAALFGVPDFCPTLG